MTKIEEAQLKIHEMYALYHMNCAGTCSCVLRNITRCGVQLTDQEKIDDSMKTALRHIELFHKRLEYIQNEERK